jgi:hypothetical protein
MILARLFYILIRPLLDQADVQVSAYGPQQAALQGLKQSKVYVSVSGLTSETQRVLTYERVIVICNHDYDIEPILLMSALPKRDSSRIIVNTVYLGLIPSLDKYLIPVNLSHIVNPQGLMHKVQDLRYGTNRFGSLSREKNHTQNITAIDTASKEIDKGSMVIIFPFPSWAPQGKWYTGVGYMLKNTSSNKPVYVLNVNIKGTNTYDWLRFLPFANNFLPSLKMAFDVPYQANELRLLDGKEITQRLEKRYKDWLENAKF